MENQKNSNIEITYKEESYHIQGAIFEVYKIIGPGFLEPVYQECLLREFQLRKIPQLCQPELQISYKGEVLALTYRADFVCFGKIIIELKAVNDLIDEYRAQIHNYLKASGMKLGLLVNFGHVPRVEIERIVL